ncbi:MAG: ribonuclease III [Alphaproteobacteria bacterium]
MTSQRAAELAAVEARIGYTFKNRAHLATALTHASAVDGSRGGETYERLEFLGDRVLGLTIADMVLTAFPEAEEGELNRRLVDLVRKETCAEVAGALNLDAALAAGGSRQQRAALRTRNVLGDICESVIAAIYLDGGLGAARAFVERNWAARMASSDAGRRSAKTALQEWAQGRGLPTPDYTIAARSGPDHAPEFVVEARVAGLQAESGRGTTRRNAEQRAAERILVREGVWTQ